MKKLLLLLFIALVACSSGPSNTVNFSGDWELDTENSDLGRRPEGDSQPMNQNGETNGRPGGPRGGFNSPNISITQVEDLLSITRTFMGRDGEGTTSEEKYNLKGKESINDSRMGEKISTAKWDKSGKILVIKSQQTMQRNDQTFTMESLETWTLINENELVIESTMSTPRGERTRKLIYFKN